MIWSFGNNDVDGCTITPVLSMGTAAMGFGGLAHLCETEARAI
jgi:hypothetical protein